MHVHICRDVRRDVHVYQKYFEHVEMYMYINFFLYICVNIYVHVCRDVRRDVHVY